MFDPSKRVFLAPNCLQNKSITDRVFKTLQEYKIPKNNILELDFDLMRKGDYLLRCIGNVIKVFEIDFIPPFGFVTKPIGELNP